MAEGTTKEIVCPECSGVGRIGDSPSTLGMQCPPCKGEGVREISLATEEAVRKILNKTDGKTGRKHNEHLVRMLILTVDGPDALVSFGGDSEELGYVTPSSLAAVKARGYLWDSYPSEIASVAACDLYYSLGRQHELGWLEKQLPDYHFEG